MKFKTALIFFLFISVNEIFAQLGEVNPNGYNVFYYPEGSKSSEGTLKDGKPDGYWKTYFPSGVLKSEGNRKNFLLDSVWIFYNDKAQKTEMINYLYGKKNGYYSKFENDTLLSKEMYLNDIQQGMSYYYYKSGKVYQEINYKDGSRQGDAKEYSEDGTLIAIYEYRYGNIVDRERLNRLDDDGKKNGIWKEFYSNGNVKSEVTYEHGVIDGYLKEYEENGKIIKSERYLKGELVVVSSETDDAEEKVEIKTEYYTSGQKKSSGSFSEKNIPVGIHKTYKEDGTILSSETYDEVGIKLADGKVSDEGIKSGAWIYYYPSGKIKSKGEYKSDKKTGAWKYFYEDGTTEQSGTYVNDKPQGEWIWYYESGKVLRQEYFVNGLEDGLVFELTELGDTIFKGNYYSGQKQGKWFYKIGDDYSEGEYKFGQKDGIWNSYYYPAMVLKSTGRFLQGLEHEKFKYYYPSGKIYEEGEFLTGKKNESWRTYDENGYVILTLEYNMGELEKVDGVNVD